MASDFSANLQLCPLDRLIPHARNARTHSEDQVAQIAGSIAEFGFVNPVLVGDDGVIVAGHGRVLAARKLGLSEAPVIVLAHLSPTQRRALMIADNGIAENASGTVKTKRGFSRLEWQKLRERNEALDCRVYARAAAWIAGADRWTEATWSDLEKQVGISEVIGDEQPADPETPADNIAGLIRRRPQSRGRRRVFRSSYMS